VSAGKHVRQHFTLTLTKLSHVASPPMAAVVSRISAEQLGRSSLREQGVATPSPSASSPSEGRSEGTTSIARDIR
jgi:hypothetical protein